MKEVLASVCRPRADNEFSRYEGTAETGSRTELVLSTEASVGTKRSYGNACPIRGDDGGETGMSPLVLKFSQMNIQ